jgi:DNA-binding NarL/FixJ family response regulator
MEEKMMLVGFFGMYGEVATAFLRDAFAATKVERVNAIESLFAGTRGEPVDCLVCSLYCLGADIEENLRRISERYPESRIACYSEFPVSAAIALRCKRGGCRYVACNIGTDSEMRRFKATVKEGNAYYPESIAGLCKNDERELLRREVCLTARQRQVLRRAIAGESVKATALGLGISDKTVSTHRKRYAQKLGTDSPWMLLTRAFGLNYISPFEVFRSLDEDGSREKRRNVDERG